MSRNKYLDAVKGKSASGSVTGRLGVGVSGDGRKGRPNAKFTRGSGLRSTKVGSRASTITEDSPQFDPVTMGNRKYGPGARRPDGSVMKRGTGPGPNGSYPRRSAARGRGPDFEGGFGPYSYNKRYKGKGIDRQLGA